MRQRYSIRALTFRFHGIARSELQASRRIASVAGVAEHRLVRLPDLKEAGDIGSTTLEGMPPTYIPMRNCIFYALAASYAEEVGANLIVGGHNKDDVESYADSTPAFFNQLGRAFLAGSALLRSRRLKIVLPLSNKTKAQVVKLASTLGVPLEYTWSCHGEGRVHCWKCPGCQSRVEAFERAGVSDPLRSTSRVGKIS